ncbi:hypothetical protein [Streptomyces sp. SID5910]|uniref:hypothetical protein n=1 Tax=Streptomyces sp. SID5910 TaxID=2690312 RepID=UPI00136D0F61|nr:hypothetical protein [Streptomyces sp. SID5910]MYR42392.1 hypothetical protein [Streptomyces sp. SID5910]
MAWDEWEQIKAAVAARQDNHTQLNSAGGTPGGPDLKTNDQGKQKAIKALVEAIRPGLDKAGTHADEDTDAAERTFTGWATGSGLKDAHDEWALQVKGLQQRLAHDQAALSKTKKGFQFVEHGVESALSRINSPGPGPHRDV